MQIDDRLTTVLRMRVDSDGVRRTQFRQLIDLLGTLPETAESELLRPAYARLSELMTHLPQEEQAAILREPGVRLRNPELVAYLAGGESKPAASAMATARLSDAQWLALIPELPMNARGFLRHRRDLSSDVKDLLARLGVQDLVLPDAGINRSAAAVPPSPTPAVAPVSPASPTSDTTEGIGALLRRIEAFREERQGKPVAPRLPLEEEELSASPLLGFEFATDTAGTVTWASGPIATLAVGLRLTSPMPGVLIDVDKRIAARLAAHQPITTAPINLAAAPDISGEWRMDAAPLFDAKDGRFTGYRGCLRRPIVSAEDAANDDSEGDAMRQVLHELRTPVNAIQGFAEIIQQQLFGPAPHEYRAHAAGISVDAAKLLAGFDEVDRLVKLDSGDLKPEEGESDLRLVVSDTVQRLQAFLRPRNAAFDLRVKGSPFHVGLARPEAMALCWRLLATAAGAMGPGETIALRLAGNEKRVRLRMKIPPSLIDGTAKNLAAPADQQREKAISAGMFGPKFSFKLAQAEAEAAGGYLKCKQDRVTLVLPALTAKNVDHSPEQGRANG
ncbi:sensor histidine kinase [Aurantiacibacter sediminis]|uniref:histidine kinase n=1 Tax=Aurantiacibacter sediminis TaxID=2793064 RepID=A0ABS0N574_9SPHN|nr:HAMP domain-containing histidine kinase [Aurantiacibacter sediminis]MBH5322951.1 HAMP domain-containing histidine kinase [Aurantiacibacter sediminis]